MTSHFSTLLGKVKTVTLRVGARAKEGKGEGERRKKYACPIIIVLLGNSERWQTEPQIGAA